MYCPNDGFPLDKIKANAHRRQNCAQRIASSSEKTPRKDADWCNPDNLITKDFYCCPKCKHTEEVLQKVNLKITKQNWHDVLDVPRVIPFYGGEIVGTDVILLTADDVTEEHNESARKVEKLLEGLTKQKLNVYYFKQCIKYRRPLTATVRFHLNVLKRCYPHLQPEKLKYFADLFQSSQFNDAIPIEIDLIR